MDMEEAGSIANTSFSQMVPTRSGFVQYSEPSYLKVLRILIEVTLGVFGVGGNLLVCVAIATRRRLKSIANLFVFNLAVADLGVLLICLPLVIFHSDFPYSWPFGKIVCKVLYPFTDIFYGVSIGSIVAISFHRYRMIVHCMEPQLTSIKAQMLILLIWLLSFLLFVLPVNLVMELHNFKGKTSCHPSWPKPLHQQLYVTFVFIIFYLLPLIIILGTYLRIRHKLSADSFLASQLLHDPTSTIKARLDQNKKALQLLTPVVIAFAILMLPINVIRLFVAFHSNLAATFKYLRLIYNLSVLLLLANSAINCIIYAVVNKDFRREFKRILCCSCLKCFWRALPVSQRRGRRLTNDNTRIQSMYSAHDPRTVEEMLTMHETESPSRYSHLGLDPREAHKANVRKEWLSKVLGQCEVQNLMKDEEYSDTVRYWAYDEKLTIVVK